jgi:hypothetical protein
MNKVLYILHKLIKLYQLTKYKPKINIFYDFNNFNLD